MNRVAIAYSTKDRTDLTRRTIEPLLQPDKFDLYWFDGSTTEVGEALQAEYGQVKERLCNVRGGSCRAIVCALTTMLQHSPPYDYVGLCENDVLLDDDWFAPTTGLFVRGAAAGLQVGAVSARCYEDRVLIQRDGFAIMHNLGAGFIIFSREAAEIILRTYRTGWTGENRKIFSILSGIDIGAFWAFKGGEHNLVADWAWDHILASRGLCSLALTPAKATQLEDIAAMGLKMSEGPLASRDNADAFKRLRDRQTSVRDGALRLPVQFGHRLFCKDEHIVFPHQIAQLGGSYAGDWRFKWSLGYGCFAWKAGNPADVGVHKSFPATVTFPLFGPAVLLLSGGAAGATARVEDSYTGFAIESVLQPEGDGQVMQLAVPGAFAYRHIRITALTSGVTFYGLRTREAQPCDPSAHFDFNTLPPL